MPKFKKITLRPGHYSPNDADYVDVQININSKGIFYCKLPAHLNAVVQGRGQLKLQNRSALATDKQGDTLLQCESFDGLKKDLELIHNVATEPLITRKLKIGYQASSNIQFALDEAGNIHKNAANNGAKWLVNKVNRALNSPSSFSTYDISFVAKVVVEVTYAHGDTVKVNYEPVHAHQDLITPEIEALNTWTRLSPPTHELTFVDYTPQLAVFFDCLIMSMAQLAKQFYDFFGHEQHIDMINNSTIPPLLDFKESLISTSTRAGEINK